MHSNLKHFSFFLDYSNDICVSFKRKVCYGCPNCFNRDNRRDVSMDINRYESLCKFFSVKDNKQIKIMGGEPTIHPSFGAMMKIAQNYFESVSLFTNAISDKLEGKSIVKEIYVKNRIYNIVIK